MPSRRSILTTCSLAASASLAGCSTISSPPGSDAVIRSDGFDLPDPESDPVVVRAETDSGEDSCPEGLLQTSARIHEVRRPDEDGPNQMLLVTKHNVITGNSGCGSGWGQTGITIHHDWQKDSFPFAANITDMGSNVVYTDDSDKKTATLEKQDGGKNGYWQVHLTPPWKSSGTFYFVSVFTNTDTLSEGDVLAKARAESKVRKGWFGGNDVLKTETTLRYGDTDRS